MNTRPLRLGLVSCLLALAVAAAPLPSTAALSCEKIPEFAGAFLQHHVRHRAITPEIERRTIDTYLRRADPSRTLLLVADVEALRASFEGIFERVRSGDCSELAAIQHQLVERSREAEVFVRSTLSAEDFQLDPSVELVIDADQRGHPETPEARDTLLRSLIQFQISNYLAAGSPLEEAKRLLIHRYELRSRRLAELDREDLYASFLDSFASSLDPHSSYLSAEALEDFRIMMSLSLEGIGVALSERDGYAVAERIIPGGAADRHKGLRPKDKIIAVAQADGEPINIIDMPLRDAVRLIRGKKGTPVRLTVLRQGEKTERFSITIVRDKIDLAEQAAKLRFETREVGGRTLKLAVLELPSFYGDADPSERQSTEDVARLLREVKREEADGLLLDLSRNGGGLLEHAVTISGYFLRRGEIVAIRDGRGRYQILADRDDDVLYSGPMVVHTSRASASASEILAGALKDYRRAVIAGDDHTFGKGTVQTVSTLPPGLGALKITNAMYFRPGGRSTQEGGVAADVTVPSPLSGEEFGEKAQRYALSGQQIAPFLGDSANSPAPEQRWRPVSTERLQELAERSQRRLEANEKFAELRRRLEETRDRGGVVHLAEILKEREEARENGSDADPDDPGAERETTPQVEEALNILADLIALAG